MDPKTYEKVATFEELDHETEGQELAEWWADLDEYGFVDKDGGYLSDDDWADSQ